MTFLCRWIKKRTPVIPEDKGTVDLNQARQERESAELKLRATKVFNPQVVQVASTSRRIRQQNQFSARLAQAFGSRRPNHDNG